MRLNIRLNISKRVVTLIILILVIFGASFLIYTKVNSKDPLPPNIKRQISYKVVYPASVNQIDPNSYSYQSDQKTLTFKVKSYGTDIVFTQQPAPDSIGSGQQPYYQALGLHPYAQFQTKLGSVALVKFWKSGSLEPVGQSAILASNGTLLIAHSDKDLTNKQWKDLLDSLKITK